MVQFEDEVEYQFEYLGVAEAEPPHAGYLGITEGGSYLLPRQHRDIAAHYPDAPIVAVAAIAEAFEVGFKTGANTAFDNQALAEDFK